MNKSKIYIVGARVLDIDKNEIIKTVDYFNKNGYVAVNPLEYEDRIRKFLTVDNLDTFETDLLTELTTKILTDKEITTMAVLNSWVSCQISKYEILAAQIRGLKIIDAETEKEFEFKIILNTRVK